ncbi:unnamed protein product [Absidia cylindrospora]
MTNPFMDKSSEMHPLSRNEEEACFKDLKEKALQHCHEYVKEHNVTVMWTCRSKLKTMNSCLNERTSREELDKLKLTKMAEKRARQRAAATSTP